MPAQAIQAVTSDRSVPSRTFQLGNQPLRGGVTDTCHARNENADAKSASDRLAAIRRTLTAPWQALNAQLNLPAGVDRSGHGLSTARAGANAAEASNRSAFGRRKSTLSVASHRSLYTVDGLPEDTIQPDAPILSGYLAQMSTANGDVSGSAGGFSSNPTSPRNATSASLEQEALYAQSSASIHQRMIQQAMNGYALPTPPLAPATAFGGGSQLPSDTTPSQPYQPYQPQPQAQAHYTAPTGDPSLPSRSTAAAANGTGLWGVMHEVLGGTDVRGEGGGGNAGLRQGAHSGEPLLRVTPSGGIPTGRGTASPRTADPAVHGGSAVAMPSAARGAAALGNGGIAPVRQQPESVGSGLWDDPRNPMSLCYDPSLDQTTPWRPNGAAAAILAPSPAGPPPPPPQPPDPEQAPAGGSPPPYKPHSVQPHSESPPPPGSCPAVAPPAAAAGAAAPADADAHFVLIDMKDTRESPSVAAATAAAAAAAYASGASASPAAPDAAAAAAGIQLTLRGRMASYIDKWRGVDDTLMPAEQPVDIWWSWLGAFLSILVVAVLHQYLSPRVSLPLMIASFGASAVLLFGVPASKLAQPRNFLGGQLVSAMVGVLVRLAFMHAPHLVWLSAALGMSLALAAMQLTRTVHPPGGASALIAASAANIGPWYGFKFILTVFFGCLAMLVVSLLINNLSSRRRYPTYWLGK